MENSLKKPEEEPLAENRDKKEKEEKPAVTGPSLKSGEAPASSTNVVPMKPPQPAVSPSISDPELLPLSDEIKKQQRAMKRARFLTWGGLLGVVVLLVVIEVSKTWHKPTEAPKTFSFKDSPQPITIKQTNTEAKKQEIKVASKVAPKPKPVKTIKIEKTAPAPVKPNDYFLYGINRHRVGMDSKAIKAFREGMEKNPELKEIGFNNLGVIFSKKGKVKKGIKYFKQALKINPRYIDAHYNLAICYEKVNRGEKAFFHYQRFLELAEDNYPGLTPRVKKHLGKKRFS